jgi:hypothetical protein
MEWSEAHRREASVVVASSIMGTTSPSWGGTSPASCTRPIYHPHCNILINMMFDAIYYFPMIYCVTIYA